MADPVCGTLRYCFQNAFSHSVLILKFSPSISEAVFRKQNRPKGDNQTGILDASRN